MNMIKKGHYAIYEGIEYHLAKEMNLDKIKIYTHDKTKIDESFIQRNSYSMRVSYRKYVQLWELEDTYDVHTDVVEDNRMMCIQKESEDGYYVFAGEEDQELIERYHLIEEDRGIYGGWISKEGKKLRERYEYICYEYICYGEKKDPETVPKPINNTYFRKVLSAEDIPKYLGGEGFSEIQGLITRYEEEFRTGGYDDVIKLCHPEDKSDEYSLPGIGDSYGYIKFKTDHVERLSNLSGKKVDVLDADKAPCILKGFTEIKIGDVMGYFIGGDKCLKPIDGAELHEVVNGTDRVIAVFREGHFRESSAEGQECRNMIRSGNYGQYNGNEYHVTREDGNEKLKIYTHDKNKTDDSFVMCNRPGERACYKKYIQAFELEKSYQVKNYVAGKESGDKRMLVLKESEDQYLVSADHRDRDSIVQYQLKEVERGIFHGWVDKKEVQLIENCKSVHYLD